MNKNVTIFGGERPRPTVPEDTAVFRFFHKTLLPFCLFLRIIDERAEYSFGKEKPMDNGASSYRRFLTGDDSVLEALIEEYRLPLQMFLYSFTGAFDLAEEAAIETFVKLAVKKPKYNGKASFKTWLYRIGRNTAADYIRKNRRNETLSLEESGVNITDAISPEDIYLKEEKNRQLALSMRKLKPEYYTVLWLKYFDGLQISEIAEIIRKSDGNTKVILSRAREALRIQLGKDGFDYED